MYILTKYEKIQLQKNWMTKKHQYDNNKKVNKISDRPEIRTIYSDSHGIMS